VKQVLPAKLRTAAGLAAGRQEKAPAPPWAGRYNRFLTGWEQIAGAAAACAFMAWAVRGRSSQVFAPSVWQGPREGRRLALTFDDGPSEGTPRILEILERHGARATFFQVGAHVERLPEISRAVREAGHEIGNHSHTHRLLCFRSAEFIETDLRRAQEAIERHTGFRPAWFRAPYGVRWPGLARAQRRLSLGGVTWTIIGYDWKLGADQVVRNIGAGVSEGAILCLHDGRELQARPDVGVTVETVRRLIPTLLERGYRLETVSELLCPKKSVSGS
jgi:peptidoglycan-N-acetylglucosamine deacetylase